MATMAEKMAASLEELRKLQEKDRCVVLQGTAEIGRTHLTRLLDNGWLQEVMKGWYIAARPGTEGDTTVWYTSFWYFIAKYAAVRLGERWCLTADQSLDLYSGKTTVPVQVVIKSPKGHNNTQKLMYDTSLLVFQSEIPDQVYKEPEYGLNLCRYIKGTDEKRGFASCRKNSRGVPEHREQRNRRQHRFHDAGVRV